MPTPIPLDNGESIPLADGTSAGDPFASVNALANGLALLMGNRERFDYTWANLSERIAQAGMVQGSRAYQEDNKSEWIYDGGWRPARSTTTRTRTTALDIHSAGGTIDFNSATDTPAVPEFTYFPSPGQFFCLFPGTFLVTGLLSAQAAGAVVGYTARLQKNGVTVTESPAVTSTVGGTAAPILGAIDVVYGDLITVLWYANIAAPGMGVDVGLGKTFITLTRIG